MKLTLHTISRFAGGDLSLATVEGLDTLQKPWIVYAGQGRYVIRSQDGTPQPDSEKDQYFDSPEAALVQVQKRNPVAP
jgi:hypothetical protein